MRQEWFQRWFGDDYKALYPHRDDSQAGAQVRAVAAACGADAGWRILDIGCGSGRHLRAFREQGLNASGIDLSPVLLRDARDAGLSVARADMRRLPFHDAAFDLAGCFFTSFGYFATFEEDVAALRGFARVLRPQGFLFLDLPNPDFLTRHLVPRETLECSGHHVELERRLEGDLVIKSLRIRYQGREEAYEERVRLFPPERLDPILRDLKLETIRTFGDERGSDFVRETSPRMSLLLRCPA